MVVKTIKKENYNMKVLLKPKKLKEWKDGRRKVYCRENEIKQTKK